MLQMVMRIFKLQGTVGSLAYTDTGIIYKNNACQFMKKNTFGIANKLAKSCNIDFCHLVKDKPYYVMNYMLDLDNGWPPYMFFGTIKVYVGFMYNEAQVFDSNWYVTFSKL